MQSTPEATIKYQQSNLSVPSVPEYQSQPIFTSSTMSEPEQGVDNIIHSPTQGRCEDTAHSCRNGKGLGAFPLGGVFPDSP